MTPADVTVPQTLAPGEVLARSGTVIELLEQCVAAEPDRGYAVDWTGAEASRAALLERVNRLQASLERVGVRRRSRVAVALPNSIDHVALVFALMRLGAVWVPLNTKLRGESLRHQLRDSESTHLVTDPGGALASELSSPGSAVPGQGPPVALDARASVVAHLWTLNGHIAAEPPAPLEGVVAVMYTSGTTGPAKGVLVTDAMLIGSAVGAVAAADPRPGDIFYMWEPLIHIGGAQLMLLPLIAPIRLALAAGLSASRFWDDAAGFGATHIHHLGGLLQMLLHQPPSPGDKDHGVRVSWGAGATPEAWKATEDRFGLRVHECYGMTETSSIVTVNRLGPEYGIGQALPWFNTAVDMGAPGAADGSGELRVRPTVPGLITPGYLNRPDATAAARDGGWWRTGDLVRPCDDGTLHFQGRAGDSIRVRGENVSAWQVESVLGAHPQVGECAAVGVDAEIGEQEILLFVVPADGQQPEPAELVAWAAERMPPFQLPRYIRFLDELPMTPSRRVAKKRLPRHAGEAVDVGRRR